MIGTGVARKLHLCASLATSECRGDAPQALNGLPNAASGAAVSAPPDILALAAQEAPHDAQTNRIELLAASAHGAPNVVTLSVIEARNMGIKAVDDTYLAMHLEQAQRLVFGRDAPQATSIIVQLYRSDDLPAAMARLKTLLNTRLAQRDLTALDFEELNPLYGQSRQFMDSLFGFLSVLIGIIVLFTIGNTMSTAVVERTVEIGTLRAIGLRRQAVRSLFLSEGLLLAALGAVLGITLALVVAVLVNHSGMTWVPPGYSYAYLILIRVWEDPPLMLGTTFGLFLVTVVSAWWPADRAARLVIVDALRHA
jgi:putative ABC transport system permease protein